MADTTPPLSRRMERGILTLFLAAATVIALALVVPTVQQIVGSASGTTFLTLLTQGDIPHDGPADSVAIESATYDSARISASGLQPGTVGLLITGMVFHALTVALTAGSIVLFLLLLLWRRPFHRALVVATQTAGAALLIGSILSTGLGGLGRMMAAVELNPLAEERFTVGFAFDPMPALAGLAVLALSFVFDSGARLQRDTQGLV